MLERLFMRVKIIPVTIVLFALFIGGCGYKLGSLTVGGIQTIAIKSVQNHTGKSTIEESFVTNTLIEEFNRDGTVNVVDPSLTDALLSLELTSFNQRAEVFNSSDVGEVFRLVIEARIRVVRSGTGEELYNGTLYGEADYESSADQTEIERTSSQEAIRDLSIDVVRAILEGGW